MIELRNYQRQALDKILWAKEKQLEGNELVVLPTGAGKSIVIAHLAHELSEPILILQPSKEILEQNLEKLCRYVDRSEVGVYSASMDEKTIGFYTFATIQSIYKKPDFFKHFRLVIIDEAHLVNPKNLDGMFTQFLASIGNPKVIGFTATPYRMDTKYIDLGNGFLKLITTTKLINRMKQFFWQRVLFSINIQELIEQKYLCPLEYVDASVIQHEDIPLNKSESDFDLEKYEKKISTRQEDILKAIQYAKSISKSVLVFCSSVHQAEHLAEIVDGSDVVTAKTPKKERDAIIDAFRDHSTQVVFNVGVLTLGFDHPSLDCIVLLRPTRSIGLYYQMVGRGVRIAEGKEKCRVIDLTSTVKNLGRVETIKFIRREKWELESETGSWHNSPLYSFTFEKKQYVGQN